MDMDMSSTATMAMTGTATMSMATATSTEMSMGGSDCKISMLWNWYTVDTCFIATSWHNTSKGMFAGSCIGVILLVMFLEFLRRSVKEFDAYLIRQHAAKFQGASSASGPSTGSDSSKAGGEGTGGVVPPFRPDIFQQAIRALLHIMQFAVAYFVMLLAMYYNGYIIICIFIGGFLGAFIFQWETLGPRGATTSAAREATVCCG